MSPCLDIHGVSWQQESMDIFTRMVHLSLSGNMDKLLSSVSEIDLREGFQFHKLCQLRRCQARLWCMHCSFSESDSILSEAVLVDVQSQLEQFFPM
jgi:hypothetical protein